MLPGNGDLMLYKYEYPKERTVKVRFLRKTHTKIYVLCWSYVLTAPKCRMLEAFRRELRAMSVFVRPYGRPLCEALYVTRLGAGEAVEQKKSLYAANLQVRAFLCDHVRSTQLLHP